MKHFFIVTVSLACAYFFTGYFSNLLLAIDGYAVAVWPPSGIALAGFLIWGRKSLLGIVLGAFFTNLIHLESASAIFQLSVFMHAAAVTFAATLQAWVGSQLVTKVIKAPLDLSSLKHCIQSLVV
ncbi:MAG TPA: histidine kinase, partial [Pseudoalteromonas sp.]|nr:histidine kinase [Pseudoalteromonas sp.]